MRVSGDAKTMRARHNKAWTTSHASDTYTEGQLVALSGSIFLPHMRRHAKLLGNPRVLLQANNELGVRNAAVAILVQDLEDLGDFFEREPTRLGICWFAGSGRSLRGVFAAGRCRMTGATALLVTTEAQEFVDVYALAVVVVHLAERQLVAFAACMRVRGGGGSVSRVCVCGVCVCLCVCVYVCVCVCVYRVPSS